MPTNDQHENRKFWPQALHPLSLCRLSVPFDPRTRVFCTSSVRPTQFPATDIRLVVSSMELCEIRPPKY